VRLSGSSVLGNGTNASCGVTETCADLAACEQSVPELSTDSSCNHSYILESGFPGNDWAVCALD
jgi:hypothetical protein